MPQARFEAIRSLGFAGISAVYAAVGAVTTTKVRAFVISNLTQGDMFFSTDGTNDHFVVSAGSFVLIDVTANMLSHGEENFFVPIGTQFYCKQITAPVEKAVYVSFLY